MAQLIRYRFMEHTTFFEHYRICKNQDGSPKEVSRTGTAINYKAVDARSGQPVMLQLIPISSVDQTGRVKFQECAGSAQKLDHFNIAKIFAVGVEHDHLGVVSEYLEGETADSWIVANGPMPADAVLRVGLQVVRAIGAASFFGLTHRAIEPSNLMIVPGQSADGGWPFVKVSNFGLFGLGAHSENDEARRVAAISPQFASPEQLLNHQVDFQSEVYSLGATMCFLLIGTAPLAVSGMKARLPELRRAPKALQNLLVHMLRESPENRPHDPVVFESEMRDCLTKVERRQTVSRKLGIPLAAVIPQKPKEPRQPRAPLVQILRGIVAFAVLVMAAAAVAGFFLQDKIPFLHRTGKIGVLIGVPDASQFESAPVRFSKTAPIAVANQPAKNASPAVANTNLNLLSGVQGVQKSNAQPAPSATPVNEMGSTQIASTAPAVEPAPPATGLSEEQPAPKNPGQSPSGQPTQSRTRSRKKTTASTSNWDWTSRNTRIGRTSAYEDELGRAPNYHGRPRSRVIGTTRDGRMILRLPSGRIVLVRPRYDEDVFTPPPRRRVYTEGPDFSAPPPPLYPPGYPFND
jgi:serine/threonine protein kinase